MEELKSLEELAKVLSELDKLLSEESDDNEHKMIQKSIEVIDKKLKDKNPNLTKEEMELLTITYAIVQKYV